MIFWTEKVPNANIFAISALEDFGVKEVFQKIIALLPESPAFYPKDQLTDKPERFFVNEIIREKILLHYKKEIPYSVEIDTEEFFEEDTFVVPPMMSTLCSKMALGHDLLEA